MGVRRSEEDERDMGIERKEGGRVFMSNADSNFSLFSYRLYTLFDT